VPRVFVTYDDGARFQFEEETLSVAHIDAESISAHDRVARVYVYAPYRGRKGYHLSVLAGMYINGKSTKE